MKPEDLSGRMVAEGLNQTRTVQLYKGVVITKDGEDVSGYIEFGEAYAIVYTKTVHTGKKYKWYIPDWNVTHIRMDIEDPPPEPPGEVKKIQIVCDGCHGIDGNHLEGCDWIKGDKK